MASALGLVLVAAFGVAHASDPDPTPSGSPSAAPASTIPFVVAPQIRFGVSKAQHTVRSKQVTASTGPRTHRPAATPGVPLRLVVPTLGVDAPVVGITAVDGVLLPPGNPQTLGWWSAGAKPGSRRGGALITGHTVHTGGGAFDDLDTLRRGDRVRVRTLRGMLRYVVSGVTIYRKASLAEHAQQVFSQTVPGRLVLVTCEDWNGETYLSNAVVIARPARQG